MFGIKEKKRKQNQTKQNNYIFSIAWVTPTSVCLFFNDCPIPGENVGFCLLFFCFSFNFLDKMSEGIRKQCPEVILGRTFKSGGKKP